jgi:hypothetical protein
MNSRHAKLSLFLCVQFVTMIPPVIRSQVDIAIALRDPIKANQKRLYDFFFGVFPSLKDFSRVFTKATDNFGALVANNRSRSSALTRCIFTYRAVERDRTIKLCCPRVWVADRAARLLRRIRNLEQELRRQEIIARGGVIV